MIPETCRTETRRILRLQHSAEKKASLKLCPDSALRRSFKEEIKPPGAAVFDEKSGSIDILLDGEKGVELFHKLIQADPEKHYDPITHIDYIDLFYPVK